MLGSIRQDHLFDGQRIIARFGMSATLENIKQAVDDCGVDISDLILAYWDYGEELVLLAPVKERNEKEDQR